MTEYGFVPAQRIHSESAASVHRQEVPGSVGVLSILAAVILACVPISCGVGSALQRSSIWAHATWAWNDLKDASAFDDRVLWLVSTGIEAAHLLLVLSMLLAGVLILVRHVNLTSVAAGAGVILFVLEVIQVAAVPYPSNGRTFTEALLAYFGFGTPADWALTVETLGAPLLALLIALLARVTRREVVIALEEEAGTPEYTQTSAPLWPPIRVAADEYSVSIKPWLLRIPGQAEVAADTETLRNLAWVKQVRPHSCVVDIDTGYTYSAREIPGVYSDRDYDTAVVLSVIFGCFGIDRFYLGRTGLGIAKLLTLGGLGVWALVDIALFASRRVMDVEGRPLA